MADREASTNPELVPELDELLEAVLLQALDEACEKLEGGEEVVPFTALAVGDSLFIETHPAEDTEDCFKMARHTVQHASGAKAYAFCYDGYVETDEGEKDALIAEGGIPGAESAHAVGYLYTLEDAEGALPAIEDDPVYIGVAPNFMEFTLMLEEVGEETEEAPEEAEDAVPEAGPEEGGEVSEEER